MSLGIIFELGWAPLNNTHLTICNEFCSLFSKIYSFDVWCVIPLWFCFIVLMGHFSPSHPSSDPYRTGSSLHTHTICGHHDNDHPWCEYREIEEMYITKKTKYLRMKFCDRNRTIRMKHATSRMLILVYVWLCFLRVYVKRNGVRRRASFMYSPLGHFGIYIYIYVMGQPKWGASDWYLILI